MDKAPPEAAGGRFGNRGKQSGGVRSQRGMAKQSLKWPAGGPGGNLVSDAAGNLYGTTSYGGVGSHPPPEFPFGNGVVFELTRRASGGWSERVLHAFLGYGANPQAGLLRGASGNLYGTVSGGTSGGLVFEIKP